MGLGITLSTVLTNLWNSIVDFVPGFIAALIILLIGYIIGWVLGWVVQQIFEKTKIIDYWIRKADLKRFFKDWDIPHFLGVITKWYVFVLFLGPAASFLRLQGLASFLYTLSFWIPNLIAGLLILLVGLFVAEFSAHKLVETKAMAAHAVASIVKLVVIIFAAIIALDQIGINIALAHDSFLIVLAGVMLGLAIAFGISFGYGFKEEAARWVKVIKKKKRF